MAFFGRLATFAKSPQGRRLINQAQKAARDPRNRERLEQVRARLQKREGGAPAKGGAGHQSGGTTSGVEPQQDPNARS